MKGQNDAAKLEALANADVPDGLGADQWVVIVSSLAAAQLAGTHHTKSDIERALNHAKAMVTASRPDLLGVVATILVPRLIVEHPPTLDGLLQMMEQAEELAKIIVNEAVARWPEEVGQIDAQAGSDRAG